MHLHNPPELAFSSVQVMELHQGFRARVIRAGEGQHERTNTERGQAAPDETESQDAISEGFGPASPDPGGACGCEGQEGGDYVDNEAPFLVRLKTVKDHKGEIRQENIADRGAVDWVGEGKGEANQVGERVQEEPRNGGGEVEMEGRGSPIGSMATKNVVAEGRQFRPERKSEPKVRVQGYRE